MTKQIINTGEQANDGTGDSLRQASEKINQNFDELYTRTASEAAGSTVTGLSAERIASLDGYISTIDNNVGGIAIGFDSAGHVPYYKHPLSIFTRDSAHNPALNYSLPAGFGHDSPGAVYTSMLNAHGYVGAGHTIALGNTNPSIGFSNSIEGPIGSFVGATALAADIGLITTDNRTLAGTLDSDVNAGDLNISADRVVFNTGTRFANIRSSLGTAMIIDANADVTISKKLGIGDTINPSVQLHVTKINMDSDMGLPTPNNTTVAVFEREIRSDIQVSGALSSGIQFGSAISNKPGGIVYTHLDNNMRFSTDHSEAMRIDAEGRVGVGSAPTERLHVNGRIRIGNPGSIIFDPQDIQTPAFPSHINLFNNTYGFGVRSGYDSDGVYSGSLEVCSEQDIRFSRDGIQQGIMDSAGTLTMLGGFVGTSLSGDGTNVTSVRDGLMHKVGQFAPVDGVITIPIPAYGLALSGFDPHYDRAYIRGLLRSSDSASPSNVIIEFNGDSAVGRYHSQSNAVYNGASIITETNTNKIASAPGLGSGLTTTFLNGTVDIKLEGFANAFNKYKTARTEYHTYNVDDGQEIGSTAVVWNDSAGTFGGGLTQITSIRIKGKGLQDSDYPLVGSLSLYMEQ